MYNISISLVRMDNMAEGDTLITDSPVGQRLQQYSNRKDCMLMFGNKTFPMVSKITLGRGSENTVVINNSLASRRHAVIQKIKDVYFICDLKSTNGTFVNGKKINADKYVKLKPGDTITIGKNDLVMR
jgi:hypothetical protein